MRHWLLQRCLLFNAHIIEAIDQSFAQRRHHALVERTAVMARNGVEYVSVNGKRNKGKDVDEY